MYPFSSRAASSSPPPHPGAGGHKADRRANRYMHPGEGGRGGFGASEVVSAGKTCFRIMGQFSAGEERKCQFFWANLRRRLEGPFNNISFEGGSKTLLNETQIGKRNRQDFVSKTCGKRDCRADPDVSKACQASNLMISSPLFAHLGDRESRGQSGHLAGRACSQPETTQIFAPSLRHPKIVWPFAPPRAAHRATGPTANNAAAQQPEKNVEHVAPDDSSRLNPRVLFPPDWVTGTKPSRRCPPRRGGIAQVCPPLGTLGEDKESGGKEGAG